MVHKMNVKYQITEPISIQNLKKVYQVLTQWGEI